VTAYDIGEIFGAVIGMMLLGAGVSWIIRRIWKGADFNISVALAMLLLAVAAGFTNAPGGRPYIVTVLIYGVAGVLAFFVVVWWYSRQDPRTCMPTREPLVSGRQFGIGDVGVVPREPLTRRAGGAGGIAWGRGFIRVWMLLAVLWTLFALLVGWNSVANPYVPTRDVAINGDTEQADLLLDYGDVHYAMEERARAGTTIKTSIRPGFNLYTGAGLEPWKYHEYVGKAQVRVDEYIRSETVARRSQAIAPLAIGVFLPPLVVLVLGWAIGWAISGFRRTA